MNTRTKHTFTAFFTSVMAPKHLVSYILYLIALSASAGTATSFAYQGVLRDETGAPLKQEQATITFRLYNSNEDKASVLWEKELNLAIDTNGLFNAELSGGNLAEVIADAEESSKALYIGLTVKNSAGEISPRQKMIATPLAAYAQNVAKAEGDFTVKGTATFEGAVSMNGSGNVFKATNVDASGTLGVTGVATLNGGTEMNGAVTMTGDVTVSGNGKLMIEGAQMSLPVGVIMMWAGSKDEIPTNCWALCDGTAEYELNGVRRKVPDLRGRFIVGVGSCDGQTYQAGDTGGSNTVTLAINQMPKHKHNFKYYFRDRRELKDDGSDRYMFGNANPDTSKDTEETGGDEAHENRPPYYALCYIIKIK